MLSRSLCLGIAILFVLTTIAGAQESKKSWWNWGSEKETRSSTFFGTSSKSRPSMTSMFKLPSWSKSKSKSKSSSNKSAYSKMTRTSKRWWNNTTDFLNPFNDSKPKATTPKDSWKARNEPPKEKKGMFDWMFVEEKKEKEINTVMDFIGQENPIP